MVWIDRHTAEQQSDLLSAAFEKFLATPMQVRAVYTSPVLQQSAEARQCPRMKLSMTSSKAEVQLWSAWLQYEDAPSLTHAPGRHDALPEYRRDVTASAVAFRPVSEDPSPWLFLHRMSRLQRLRVSMGGGDHLPTLRCSTSVNPPESIFNSLDEHRNERADSRVSAQCSRILHPAASKVKVGSQYKHVNKTNTPMRINLFGRDARTGACALGQRRMFRYRSGTAEDFPENVTFFGCRYSSNFVVRPISRVEVKRRPSSQWTSSEFNNFTPRCLRHVPPTSG
ncbi:hypothetical protein EVAR_29632_1 [Eumeta japonica]|uniref:Uncharacterized protein n=1 Tax=Eumeta variegata TaxID=151549 RepID=A0A4C1W805_EUMVA|nr:hypothetical protein EVAR_29632_1 [Eumeta japonica]